MRRFELPSAAIERELVDGISELGRQRDAALAEVERLRAALEHCRDLSCATNLSFEAQSFECNQIARTALNLVAPVKETP